MRSFKPLAWLVAGLICLGGTDALAKENVDWTEYLEPKGGSKTQLTPTGKTTTAKATKKKTVAKKKASKGKRSKRQARRR
ncbi:MAG: hypothetical protein M4D80_40605 [Myxococcota bacterium]|nr:hypothetical protein [Deltaproteobacteria bacterium]MDQ3341497.1 hypothetical protein [Myxococcota bacterium]